MRDCKNCTHYVEKVEIGKGSSPEHYFGCDSWECEFEPTTKNDLGVDCISRKEVDRIINKWLSHPDYELKDHIYSMTEKIHNLPSVTPQEPRKGHWIMTSDYLTTAYGSIDYVKCSCCGEDSLEEGDYCPNCGADMRADRSEEE